MNILIGKKWTSICYKPTSKHYNGVFNLECDFFIDTDAIPNLQNYINHKIGVCLLRKRSKPIIFKGLIQHISYCVGYPHYYVECSSDGKFDPITRTKHSNGQECRIFI